LAEITKQFIKIISDFGRPVGPNQQISGKAAVTLLFLVLYILAKVNNHTVVGRPVGPNQQLPPTSGPTALLTKCFTSLPKITK